MSLRISIDPDQMSLQSRIQVEGIRALYSQSYFILISNVLISSLLAFLLFGLTGNTLVLYWLSLMLGFTAFRFLMVRSYYRKERTEEDTIRWGWFFAVNTFISGCAWGATSVLFLDTSDPVIMLVLLMTMTGVTVGSSASLSNFAWSYYAFAIPTLLPFAYVLASEGSIEFAVLAAMLTVFLILQILISRKNKNIIDESIRLRSDNSALVQQLLLEKNRVESESAAKTRFLAAASHDLRQPMHAMGLFLDILDEQSQGSPQAKIIEKIKRSSAALESLLVSLLDISKLDANAVSVENRPFKIQSHFDLLANEFESIAAEKKLQIRFAPCSLYLTSDKQVVERILRNFISNAIRYTEQGRVLVGCRRRETSVVISVYDTGIGIQPDKTQIVFEEFQQLNNHSRDRSKGLGLGLAIVRRLADLLEAKLSLKTTAGKGSVFSIELPSSSVEDITQLNLSAPASTGELSGKFVVIVEDEVEIRDGLNLLLDGWGCEIEELSGAGDVKRVLSQSRKPDLIVTDYRLPDRETGLEVIREIHDFYQDSTIPAIIVTGDTSPDRIKQVGDSGFVVLHKPVPGGKLRATMNSLLLSI
ncbi:MAG: hybrid sensor histidine kinase/response regulator [Gammaproteobacteria bacterium]|nr:hybrid sensor histidine kinase/response regulator [Gammaproteobacteria bacterium]